MTGSTLAFSRAVGETAPLLVIGAVSFVAFSPTSPSDPFTSVPTQIYSWIARPEEGFRSLAAGASIVLFSILLAMNVLAALIRAAASAPDHDPAIRRGRGPGAGRRLACPSTWAASRSCAT